MYLVPRAVHLALSFFFDRMIFAFLVCGFSSLFIILILVNVFIYHKVGWILILLRKEKNYNSMYVYLLVYIYTSCQSYYSVQSLFGFCILPCTWFCPLFTLLINYLSEEYLLLFAKVSLLPITYYYCYYYHFGYLCEFDFSTPFENYAFPSLVLFQRC